MSFDELSGLTRAQIESALEPLRRAAARIERIIKGGRTTEFGTFEALAKRGALEAEIRRLELALQERLAGGVDAVARGAAAAARAQAPEAAGAVSLDVSPTAILRAQISAAEQVVGVGRAIRTALNQAVVDALTGGSDREAFDAAIRDAMGPDVLETRVERIARTELSKAYMGQQAAADQVLAATPGVDLIKRWVKSGKGPGRSRPEHDAIHGQERELDDLFDMGGGATAETPPGGGAFRCMGPLDPSLPAAMAVHCFPGNVLVSGRFTAGLRAFYDGDAVEVETHGGRRLTVTPNHPVATVHGFVPAGRLREGDYVIGYDLGGVHAGAVHHEQETPAEIQQVFGALAKLLLVVRRDARPVELHGDALNVKGHIEIVAPYGELLERSESTCAESVRDLALATANVVVRARALDNLEDVPGASLQRSDRNHAAAAGAPGCGQSSSYGAATSLEAPPHNEIGVGPAAKADISLAQPAGDDAAVDARFLRELQDRDPRLVAPDKITRVRRFLLRAHVYDLQSPLGWLVAGGIVTSNCGCDVVRVPRADARQPYIDRTPRRMPAASAAAQPEPVEQGAAT